MQSNKEAESQDESYSVASKGAFVSKHDRHMQIINTSIYEKKVQQRNKAIEETRRQKAARRDLRERQKIRRHFQEKTPKATASGRTNSAHEIVIDGLRFHVLDGGSKLARMKGQSSLAWKPHFRHSLL